VQEGYLGLLNAIDQYDPSRGTPFLAFARHFVRGEITHYLRDHRWVIRHPRWLDRVFGRIGRIVAEYVSERGRYPGLAGLAEALEVDARSAAEILKTGQAVRTLSLDAEDGGREDLARSQRHQEAPPECSPEDRLVLIDALMMLKPLQRTIVFYMYFANLTQAEVARLMGISQKHVSRVLAGALLRLRQALTPLPPRG
jgi:RNA polymerase sigma-B factor